MGLSVPADDDRADHVGCRLQDPSLREGGMKAPLPAGTMAGTPQVLLAHHLKVLKLPTFLREYEKVAGECAREGVDHPRYLLRLAELELTDRERRLLRLQQNLAAAKLLIIDELGYVPLSQTGAELLFEVFSQRHERSSTIVTSNLPFEEWTSVFGSERLTGALLDRLTHHVHILEMNGESYRLKHSKA